MKKYVMLFTFTCLAVAGVVVSGNIIRNQAKSVNAVKLEPVTAESSVICTGKVERTSYRSVYAPYSAVATEVSVKVGDKVSVGQELMRLKSSLPDTSGVAETYAGLFQSYASPSATENNDPVPLDAPVSGEVIAVNVTGNSMVDPTKPVAVIVNDPALQIRLSVNESQIANIRLGQNVVITGVGFKDSIYYGSVKSIATEAKQVITVAGQETAVEVLVSVTAPKKDIKPGYTAKAKIITSKNDETIVVPYESVKTEKDGTEYVFCLVDGRAVKTPIVTGTEFENGMAVESGLTKDQLLITAPEGLTDGAFVSQTVEAGQ